MTRMAAGCFLVVGLLTAGSARGAEGELRALEAYPEQLGPGSAAEFRYQSEGLDGEPPAAIRFDLPEGRFVAVRTHFELRERGWSWQGAIDGQGSVTLVREGPALAGLVRTPGVDYELGSGPDGEARLARLDPARFPPCAEPLAVDAPETGEPPVALAPAPFGTDPIPLDVMVVYTPAARLAAGGEAQIRATIQAAVDITNTAYANSMIRARLDLVHAAEAPFDDTGTGGFDLRNVQDSTTVQTWRDQQGADLVGLIVADTDACGLGYLQQRIRPSFEAYAYQVTARGCAVGNLTFAHEFGHNQGCEHDPANGNLPSNASFPFAFGHFHSGAYRTVMAYANQCTGGCRRAPYFSNGNVSHQSLPTGVPDERENYRTVNLSAPVVSAFRPPAVELALVATQVDTIETSSTVRLRVRRSGLVDREVSLEYATVSDTALEGADFGTTSGRLSWAAGDAADKVIDIPLFDDVLVEGSEHFNLYLHAPRGAALGARTATITVEDVEVGLLQVTGSRSVREDAEGLDLTVERTRGHDGAIEVQFATRAGSATRGLDYVEQSGTLRWADGDDAPQTVRIPILDDRLQEGVETVTLVLSNPVGGVELDTTETLVSILDWEEGTVGFVLEQPSVREDAGAWSLPLTRTGGSDGALVLEIRVEGGQAMLGADFELPETELRWAEGQTEATLDLTLLDDAIEEGDETLILALSARSGNSAVGPPTTLTVTDWEQGRLSWFASRFEAIENQGSLTLTVLRRGGRDGPASATVRVSSGTALEGEDFALDPTTLQWADGESGPRTFGLAVLDDRAVEGEELLELRLEAEPGSTLEAPITAEVRIQDYEEGTLALVEPTLGVLETDGQARFQLRRENGSDGPVVVRYQVLGLDGADPGEQLGRSEGELRFEAGEQGIRGFDIPIVDDAEPEPTQRFTVALTLTSTGAALPDPSGLLVLEDAGVGRFDFVAPAPSGTTFELEESSRPVQLRLERSGELYGPVRVRYRFESGSGSLGSDLRASDGELSWDAEESGPKSIEVVAIADDREEGAETLSLVLEANGPGAMLQTDWTVRIVDRADEGCGCRTRGSSPPSPLLLLGLTVLGWRHRRRRARGARAEPRPSGSS